ncbi:helix-turn-helix domain-containing protein [Streptococcus macacae]|uniref:DNA-binding helix-turn-helix protein n=1 Tax=Streptococcus macacae NCTC 11558 TaxID=764298 RepID=G5JW24_9STRE|nr:XRE family transcriptional regulator [Streptococcus macacae]EHJ52785.1 DNA-binding helix-turn-helix protein [Streptococcus macacae NCTC 11558]SUN79359.1 transcriptional regulator [Streptococcus macacae NCTC 11558]
MSVKETIGQKIREEREKKGLSREQLCAGEEELTVRQLVRIELGQSLPSIVKLEYIADVLKTDLSTLLAGENITIPEDYFAMKYQLFKFPSYGDSERLSKKVQMIEDIYEKYFEILPEEELFTLELMDNALDYLTIGKTASAEVIFEDFFKQLLLKDTYSLNDLLLVKYYAIQCQSTKTYDEATLQTLENKILQQETSGDEYYNIELLGVLTAVAGVYLDHGSYSRLKTLTDRMSEVVTKTQQHSAKPLVLIYEAKYYLYAEHNKEKAKECYDLAALLAQNFGDEVLEANLLAERKSDGI